MIQLFWYRATLPTQVNVEITSQDWLMRRELCLAPSLPCLPQRTTDYEAPYEPSDGMSDHDTHNLHRKSHLPCPRKWWLSLELPNYSPAVRVFPELSYLVITTI